MFLGTHACLPVVIVSAIDIISMSYSGKKIISNIQLALVAFAGILPDLLWPHFSINQRLNSWTHTLWFLILLLLIVLLIARRRVKEHYLIFSLIFWVAVLLHLFTDALSGGIKFFFPFGEKIGGYYISYPTWKKWEIISIGSTAILLFFRYLTKTKFQPEV